MSLHIEGYGFLEDDSFVSYAGIESMRTSSYLKLSSQRCSLCRTVLIKRSLPHLERLSMEMYSVPTSPQPQQQEVHEPSSSPKDAQNEAEAVKRSCSASPVATPAAATASASSLWAPPRPAPPAPEAASPTPPLPPSPSAPLLSAPAPQSPTAPTPPQPRRHPDTATTASSAPSSSPLSTVSSSLSKATACSAPPSSHSFPPAQHHPPPPTSSCASPPDEEAALLGPPSAGADEFEDAFAEICGDAFPLPNDRSPFTSDTASSGDLSLAYDAAEERDVDAHEAASSGAGHWLAFSEEGDGSGDLDLSPSAGFNREDGACSALDDSGIGAHGAGDFGEDAAVHGLESPLRASATASEEHGGVGDSDGRHNVVHTRVCSASSPLSSCVTSTLPSPTRSPFPEEADRAEGAPRATSDSGPPDSSCSNEATSDAAFHLNPAQLGDGETVSDTAALSNAASSNNGCIEATKKRTHPEASRSVTTAASSWKALPRCSRARHNDDDDRDEEDDDAGCGQHEPHVADGAPPAKMSRLSASCRSARPSSVPRLSTTLVALA